MQLFGACRCCIYRPWEIRRFLRGYLFAVIQSLNCPTNPQKSNPIIQSTSRFLLFFVRSQLLTSSRAGKSERTRGKDEGWRMKDENWGLGNKKQTCHCERRRRRPKQSKILRVGTTFEIIDCFDVRKRTLAMTGTVFFDNWKAVMPSDVR